MDDSGLGAWICEALGPALAVLASCELRALDLAANGIGDEGCAHLAHALVSPGCGLTELHIPCCAFCAPGARAILTALASSSITKLNMGGMCASAFCIHILN